MNPQSHYTQKLSKHSNQYFKNFTEKLTGDWVQEQLALALKKVEETQSLEDWEKAILYWNELKSHIETHFELVELAYNCYTKDEALEKEERRLKVEVEPVYDEGNAKIRKKVLASSYRADLQNKFGEQYFLVLQIKEDAFHPENIKLDTKLNGILSDYTKLTGSGFFEVEGKKYPLAHYKKFANHPDEKIRRSSFLSFSHWYLDNREALEDIFDQSQVLRDKMGRELGFPDFTSLGYKRMRRTDYGPEEVASIREQILEVLVPITQKIRAEQAQALGKDKVPIWSLDYFPQWKVGPMKVSIKEQPKTALKVFQDLSPKLGGHFKKMMDWGLIDLEAREGKGPGAFCTDFSDYRVPFIFLNSVGEMSDVSTLLHETGHSFQAWESGNIDLMELRWPTLEACEVHSMGMEFLSYPYLDAFYEPQDAQNYKKKHLVESLILLPYIAMVDEFQHEIYSGRAQGPEGRSAAWEKIEEKYMPGLDFSDRPEWKRHRWIRQLHIFRAPFYYIDYAIAQIGAWQLWMQSLQDKDAALQNYLNLCRLGGSLALKDFFAAGKLKLPFEKGVLQTLMDQVMATDLL